MKIFNGVELDASMATYQQTDFSKVTARPEFVLKGKTFYDETGQLRVGTAEFITIAAEEAESN